LNRVEATLHLRSVDLVDKIIEKIGVKDNSVVMSGNAMFRIPEFVIARIVLDVTKPLLDSITLSISKDRKIKVFIHYEKLVKICSFCGHLFHNVNSCNQMLQILCKLNPVEAVKVPEVIYGLWRTQESEIPAEARIEETNDRSQDPYIQSLMNFFQKGASSSAKGDTTLGKKKGIFPSYSNSMQMVPTAGLQLASFNATMSGATEGVLSQAQHVQHGAGVFGHGPPSSALISLGNQGPKTQDQVHPWHMQNPFPSDHQWQRHVNPFILQGVGQQNMQANNQGTGRHIQGMGSSDNQFGSSSPDDVSLSQHIKNQQSAPENQSIPAVKPRRRVGAQSRWDQGTSAGDDGTQDEGSSYRVHAHEPSITGNLALGDNQDPGGNCVKAAGTIGNTTERSDLIQDQLRTEDQHVSAMSLDDESQHDNSSFRGGALAPALKAPQEP
ncbi:hypothetical protein EJB05_44487, partial [Eragrostis curvula]